MYVCKYLCRCDCIWRLEKDVRYPALSLHVLFVETGFITNPGAGYQPVIFLSLHLTALGLQVYNHARLLMGAEI